MDVSIELQQEFIKAVTELGANKPIWESPFAIGLLTTFAAISASLIQRWQAFRLQERQSQIERQLRIHELQMGALKSLALIEYTITPNDEPIQGADTHECLSPIAHSLSKVVSELDRYLKDYSYVSPAAVILHVRKALVIANAHKWKSSMNNDPYYEPSSEEINAVVNLIKLLSNATKLFKISLGVTGA